MRKGSTPGGVGGNGKGGDVVQHGVVQGERVDQPAHGPADVVEGPAQQAPRVVDPVAPQTRGDLLRLVVQQHAHRPGGRGGDHDGVLACTAHAQVGAQPVRDRREPVCLREPSPPLHAGGVHVPQRLVRIEHGGQHVLGDPGRLEHPPVPVAGAPVEQPGPRGGRGAGGGGPEQPQPHVLADAQPALGRRELLGPGLAQPPEARRQVAGVQPRTHLLLDVPLVQLLAQLRELGRAAGVPVGEALGHGGVVRVHAHQGGRERVDPDAAHPPRELLPVAHAVQDLGDLPGHLVRVDHGGAVRARGEGVRDLVAVAAHGGPGGVVQGAARGGGADVQRHHQRVLRLGEVHREVCGVVPVGRVPVLAHVSPAPSRGGA